MAAYFIFGAQSNGVFRKKATIKPKKTQNLIANHKFSANFYYICIVLKYETR